MNAHGSSAADQIEDAAIVAALFAVDPVGTGGVCVRSLAHPLRDRWISSVRDSLPAGAPMRRIPCGIPDDRLLGGLDLAATLRAGRPVAQRGVLAEANGGLVIAAMAERLTSHTAALLSEAQESGEIRVARDGVSVQFDARFGIVALDESMSEDERIPDALLDRLAFMIDLNGLSVRTALPPPFSREQIAEARRRLPAVRVNDEIVSALCATALALAAGSPRVSWLAWRAARASAALGGRTSVTEDDAILAARLVFAPRAAAAAEAPSEPQAETAPPEPGDDAAQPRSDSASEEDGAPAEVSAQDLKEIVLAAAQASIPEGLLEKIRRERGPAAKGPVGRGRAGALRSADNRGRPCGVRRGAPRGRARMNLIETLRAAAPWQRLRAPGPAGGAIIRVAPEDFRVTRFKQRTRTLTIFAVDASGSAALNRLAEAKGAVELLLADCYIRRDQVAVISFRGRTAELLLPPTRSLVRAKRSLAGLPGGGGTPLASAIVSAVALANQAQRRGETPTLVILTDGRANIGRGGEPGRDSAHKDAVEAARAVTQSQIAALFIDTSPRPNPFARQLAAAMRAQYIPLPHANAHSLSSIVAGSRR